MNPLPPPIGTGEIRFWRLDDAAHATTWASGEGSFRVGGRWNSIGVRTVYAALDPATAILEVAVHKGFKVLDTKPHVLTGARIIDPALVHVVRPEEVPHSNWLVPGAHGAGQRSFGDQITAQHVFVLVPSAVSARSWNVLFDAGRASGRFDEIRQEPFALDPRLHPPA